MKYTIEGFLQEKAVELGLTAEDLVILRWFVDFYGTGKMVKYVLPEGVYAWVDYKTVLEELPIIRCNKRNLVTRFHRLVDAGVLINKTIKQGGTFSVYGFGKAYDTLVYQGNGTSTTRQPITQNQTTHYSKPDNSNTQNQATPLSETRRTKIHLQDNPSIRNQSTSINRDTYTTKEKEDKTESTEENKKRNVDYQAIVNAYKEICTSLPSIRSLSDTRKRMIRARLNNGYTMEDFTTLFQKAQASNFLTGKTGTWTATFDWLLNETNMLKVLEGNYDNRKKSDSKPSEKIPPKYCTTELDYNEGWD